MDVITSVDQLRAVSHQFGLTSLFVRPPFYRFAMPSLPDASNRDASERLSNYQNACGCLAGGLTMGMAVIAYFVLSFISGDITSFGFQDFGLFIALFVVSTLLGKVLGVAWARIGAMRLIRRMVVLAEGGGSNRRIEHGASV